MSVRPARQFARLLPVAALCLVVGCSSSRPGTAPAGPLDGAAAKGGSASVSSVRAHIDAGNELLSHGRYDDAEREFRLALEAEPGNLEATAGLGQVQVHRGEYSDAVPLLERATRPSSQMVAAFRSLGDAYAALGDVEKAAVAYRQAVALAPGDLSMRLALARSLTEVGDYSEATSVCTGALRMTKGQPEAQAQVMHRLGEVYAREGKIAESMSAYYKASELNPHDPEIARGAAAAAVRGGLYAEAASALDRLLQLSPLDIDAKKQLAWVNFKLERYPIAIRDYEAVGDSLGTVDRYYLAQAYAKSNKVDRAVELFREVVRLDPENYKGVYCNMAYAYYDATRYGRAIETAKEGLAGDSASTCLKFCWAQALDKLGRHEEAIPMFEAVLADPAYAESAQRELERQRRIVRLLKTKDRAN